MPNRAAGPEDVATLPTRHRGVVMGAVMAVSICQFLDATIANVALPHMQAGLGASLDSISWVITSFIMASAIFTPITGWLADRVGSRRLFLLSTSTFLGASALCGAATTLPAMVLFRTLQGAAAAMMGPLSQTLMFDVNPPSKQAGAVSLWGAVSMVAPISGPFIGGFLTEQLNWRWVYYVNLPIGVPALFLLWFTLPSRQIIRRKLDLAGYSILAVGLAALQLVLDRGQQEDWFSSWEITLEALIAASCFWMFLVRSLLKPDPLFPTKLFHNPNFVAGMAFMVALGVANIALSATLPTLYQTVYHYPVMSTGLLMAPRGIALTVTMLLTNRLIAHVDFRLLISFGFLILAGAMWEMAQWAPVMGSDRIIIAGLIQGAGLGFVFTPINLIAFGSLSPELRTDGSSLLGLFRSIGGSFGVSYIVTMLARTVQTSHASLAAHVTATAPGLGGDGGLPDALSLDGMINQQAAMIAYLDNFRFLTVAMLVLAPLPFLLRARANSASRPR